MSTEDQTLSAELRGEALLTAKRPELQPLIDHVREVAHRVNAADGYPARYHLFTNSWHYPTMESTGRVLGPASTNFNDYVGTVAADDADAFIYESSLYELADLDRDRYTILAVELRVEGRTTGTVYAIDRVEHPDALASEIAARSQSQGEVPVVSFDIPEGSAEEFIRGAFSRISVRLVTQPLRDHALVVTGLSQPRT